MCDLLLLDDDPLVRSMLGEALRDEGLDVTEAAGEAEALAALRHDAPPRLFVTDLDLGTKRNGFVVAGIARILFPQVPIIYITGRPQSVAGRTMSDNELIMHKPFRPSELIASVHRMMARSALH